MTSRSISKTLKYNEEKVVIGKAECIAASNFLKERSRLTREDKLLCFKRRMELNERVSTIQHITLNFDPADILSNDQMKNIAEQYMKDIGFEKQPYLVYRHYDAGHPHCHIVTTHIRRDGSPIVMYNIGRNQSEKARKHIEIAFGLVTAAMKEKTWQQRKVTDEIEIIKYGDKPLTQSVSQVVEFITRTFKCTSLVEFNAVFRLYNVEASGGKEGSRLQQNRGLLYRVLDENKKYVGLPIKASYFDFKPTLATLEKKFVLNRSLKEEARLLFMNEIGDCLIRRSHTLQSFFEALKNRHIYVVMLRDKLGACKQINYVDFRSKCVFRGDELGKYGSRDVVQRIIDTEKSIETERSLRMSQKQEVAERPRLSLSL